MLRPPPTTRLFVCTRAVDLRRSFDGLAALTRDVLCLDPLSGHLFIFFNRRRDRVKILYFDGDGFALWMKRLEKGTFAPVAAASEGSCARSLSAAELAMLLEGIDIVNTRRRARYKLPAKVA
ncbi:MAG TPA: IS66 family insertion sequence element accessory protein TnpB [Candidatus Binatia bacterium]|nr:IS66 family insertion sequence element accessory protein TnpB [Candidatus Binatia bacterium]